MVATDTMYCGKPSGPGQAWLRGWCVCAHATCCRGWPTCNPRFLNSFVAVRLHHPLLQGIFIADALSMPVHWYYDVGVLKRDFGTITSYQPPKERHPGGC